MLWTCLFCSGIVLLQLHKREKRLYKGKTASFYRMKINWIEHYGKVFILILRYLLSATFKWIQSWKVAFFQESKSWGKTFKQLFQIHSSLFEAICRLTCSWIFFFSWNLRINFLIEMHWNFQRNGKVIFEMISKMFRRNDFLNENFYI